MEYFLLIDALWFEDRLRPALTTSWRQRSFVPCRDLCRAMLPRVETFHNRYHVGEGESLLEQVADSLVFERTFWQALAGELLLYAADEIPEFQTCPATLALLDPEHERLFQMAHYGSRLLTFGAAVYRPDFCGLNHRDDVEQLTRILSVIDPLSWNAVRLSEVDDSEREEELAFVRDCFAALADTYRRAAAKGQVIVHEIL